MPKARGLDEQAMWPSPTKQSPEANLKRRTVDTTQAPSRHFTDCDTLFGCIKQSRIEPYLAKFIDQYGPALTFWSLRHQVADKAGLASAQRAGNHMSRNVT